MRIGLIGFGNLGKAFVKGLIASGMTPASICVTARSEKTMTTARDDFHVTVCQNATQIVERCDCIILAVKPDTADTVLEDIRGCSGIGKTLVSFAAGVPSPYIRERTNPDFGIARAMPNLAVMIGRGVIGLSVDEGMDEARRQELRELLESVGTIIETDDEGIDRITALSACGLAFAAYAVEAFAEAGAAMGIPAKSAEEMALQVFLGASETMDRENIRPRQLINRVATPGGVTREGLR